jgi:protein O-GlcNAc transferase
VIRSRDAGQALAGIDLIRRAITIHPNVAAYHENLGIALALTGDYAGAISAYHVALSLDNKPPETWFNLANAMRASDRFDDAIAAYDCAIALRPDFLAALNNRAMALHESDRTDEAIAEYEQALNVYPTSFELWKNMGNSLQLTGQLQRAIEAYLHAGADSRAIGNALYVSNYMPDTTVASLLESHGRWAAIYASPLASAIQPHNNDRTPDRTLRVGFVSPDFSGHPVGRFLLPLLAHLDRARFHVFCYSDTTRVDDVTRQFRAAAKTWRPTSNLSDEQLAATIRQDQIDILIDLTMHTRGSRLLAFARKPAPVQASYLAYVGTTGLPTIDYRLTDTILDPPDDPVPWVEQPMRLQSFWCYRPPPDAGAVAPLPADSTGFITFGCLNAFSKINPRVCELWASILSRMPSAKLLLHVPRGSARDRMRERFGSRVEFVSRIARAAYFPLHGRIDVALDPFPYPGGTTTCDALWMGVPVVTLAGKLPMARAGSTILGNANLPELIAQSEDQYLQIATVLANDRDRLRNLRVTLRDRLRSAPLMDEVGFTRAFESALRRMWTAWCDAAANRP